MLVASSFAVHFWSFTVKTNPLTFRIESKCKRTSFIETRDKLQNPILNNLHLSLKSHVRFAQTESTAEKNRHKAPVRPGSPNTIFSYSIINLVNPFDDKGNPDDLNACRGDKASASLNSKIEAVNLRGNNNFLFFCFTSNLLWKEKAPWNTGPLCLPIMKGLLKPEIGYIPEWAAIWQTDKKLWSV